MKNFKKLLSVMSVSLAMILLMSSCYESRYQHHYNHHSRGWYDRHHRPPPAGVNFELDIRK